VLHRTGTIRDQRPSPVAVLPCRIHSGCMRCSGRRGQRTRSRMARTAIDSAEPARDRVCTCSWSSHLPPARSCSCCGGIARTRDLCFRWRRSLRCAEITLQVRRNNTLRRLHSGDRGLQGIYSRSCSQTPGPISRRLDREWAPQRPADR
jgi:hypothetical protein